MYLKKDAATVKESMRRFYVHFPFAETVQTYITDHLIDTNLNTIEEINRNFRFFEPKDHYHDLAKHVDGLVDKVFNSGKGWLIPADIIVQASRGVNSFIIIQPFGCLPNHITGRGIIKSVKKRLPHIQVLSLDFDPRHQPCQRGKPVADAYNQRPGAGRKTFPPRGRRKRQRRTHCPESVNRGSSSDHQQQCPRANLALMRPCLTPVEE